jgi:hypothetical protein
MGIKIKGILAIGVHSSGGENGYGIYVKDSFR